MGRGGGSSDMPWTAAVNAAALAGTREHLADGFDAGVRSDRRATSKNRAIAKMGSLGKEGKIATSSWEMMGE